MKIRRPLSAAAAAAALLVAAGCSTPPWEAASTTATPVAVPTPEVVTPAPAPVRAKVKNDLSRGVAKHTLDAGAIELKTVYYSNMPMAQWTPEANKPLTLSLTADFPEGYKQDIYLAEVDVRIDVTGPDGPLASPAPIVDQATVSPGYLIKKPNSYGNVFTVPAVPEGAQSVTLTFTYQLLAPSKPKSKTYSKQVTTDTVTVAINSPVPATPATPTPAPSATPTPLPSAS
ncbi:hypothetical protein [Microlunatus antarcticus]|uniref:Uncharacterized protein n=1 Tax=Microlunatus antarcticus TaxID=53388 RepID=A0A7W5P8K4_9ACTN|nr:hypothetical protein [Microlunatus antarcticus]MBB3328744.1 hypothetical protein [Microlunatus antarcticus]